MYSIGPAMATNTTSRRPDAEDSPGTHDRIIRLGREHKPDKMALPPASVRRVMRAAGLTIGGFYAHFRSKAGDGNAEVGVFRPPSGFVVPGRFDPFYLTAAANRDNATRVRVPGRCCRAGARDEPEPRRGDGKGIDGWPAR